jgi:hypothetical protein
MRGAPARTMWRASSAAPTSHADLRMWLEAIFTREDLQEVVGRFSPLKILLGDNGSLLLVAPSEVSLLPDRGIGVTCDATLTWPVLGLDIPVSMHGLVVHVLPAVEERPEGPTLVFRLQIDHAGVALLPSFFDHSVVARVNQELERKHIELAWNFARTLSHAFALPSTLASAAAFSIRATAGRVKATENALGLAVDFEASVQARDKGASSDAGNGASPEPSSAGSPMGMRDVERPLPEPAPRKALDSRSLAVGATAACLVVAGIRAFARSASGGDNRRHEPALAEREWTWWERL